MVTFVRDALDWHRSSAPLTPFMGFFVYVWVLWVLKALAARRYRPLTGSPAAAPPPTTTVIVPVYNEAEALFRRVLASVVANEPTELIAVVDGGDPDIAA